MPAVSVAVSVHHAEVAGHLTTYFRASCVISKLPSITSTKHAMFLMLERVRAPPCVQRLLHDMSEAGPPVQQGEGREDIKCLAALKQHGTTLLLTMLQVI
jgi:hypothetical protein